MHDTDAVAEARRDMEICNACRYCEGYCAVFPAMELRREFSNADLSYLANLCHDCRGCFYACQYAPPHEFNLNLPQAFARLRAETYRAYAWPGPFAALFRHNGVIVSLIVALALAGVLLLTTGLQAPSAVYEPHTGVGAFYAVIPLGVMIAVGLATFGYAVLALAMGTARFWRDTGAGLKERVDLGVWRRALGAAVTLRNLSGGGFGCNDRNESFSSVRRWLHHAMFYGFVACFAATCVATIYHHVFGWVAPYPLLSVPVVLGTVGGIGLLIGTTGLLVLKIVRDPAPARELLGADVALLLLLAAVAATGLLLLALRDSAAMGILLAVHLGFVLALFLVLPYGKFVHGIYRLGALVHYAAETAPARGGERTIE